MSFPSAGRLAAFCCSAFLLGCATPLQKAAWRGDVDQVSALLARGAQINEAPREGLTPLMWAAYSGNAAVARVLLEYGADPNVMDIRRRTALWYAAANGHDGIVKLLIEKGADPNVVDALWTSAERAASGRGFHEVAAGLRRAVAKAPKLETEAGDVGSPTDADRKAPRKSEVDTPKRRAAPRPDDFALIIGVEKYRALPDASFALRDALAVRRHARAMGIPEHNIIHLTGPEATRSAIEGFVREWLPRNVKPGSMVLVYFSGHGTPDLATGEAYLVPWDGDSRFLTSTGYATQRLFSELAKLPASDVLVALDACFSGRGPRSVLPRGARPLVQQRGESFDFRNMTLMAAAGPGEVAGSDDEEGHGLFTYFFLKGLGGDAAGQDGKVTIARLYEYLKPLVSERAHRQNMDQTPFLAGPSSERVIADWSPVAP